MARPTTSRSSSRTRRSVINSRTHTIIAITQQTKTEPIRKNEFLIKLLDSGNVEFILTTTVGTEAPTSYKSEMSFAEFALVQSLIEVPFLGGEIIRVLGLAPEDIRLEDGEAGG